MSDRPKRRRGISILLSVFLVLGAFIFLGVMKVNSFFRRKLVKLTDLKFPVLAVRGSGYAIYATWDSDTLCNISKSSTRIPKDGMILIDSDFNIVTLANTTYNKGDFAWIARSLFDAGFRYTFDLRKRDDSGLEAALKCLSENGGFSDDVAEDSRMREELGRQTSMEGILKTLGFQKPVAVPDTQPASTEPSPETTEPLPGDELP